MGTARSMNIAGSIHANRRSANLEREQRVTYDLENDRRGRTSAVNLQAA